MADLSHIRPNHLRRQVRNQRRRLLMLGIPLLGLASTTGYFAFGLGLIVLAILWRHRDQRLHGAMGEDMALGIPKGYPGSLAGLPDSYIVYNQLRVPHGESHREFDFIVVGPNGIFGIEIKHYRGRICGSESDKTWRQKKRSRTGHVYENDMRNPVAQIKSAIYPLKQYLAAHGANNWIQGIVVFTHPECELEIGETSVPVLSLKELAPYITRHRPLWPVQHPGIVVRALKVLREWSDDITRERTLRQILTGAKNQERLKPLVPQPIKNFMRDFVTRNERMAGKWLASTIHGDPCKGTGILNNELYIGRQVWNRSHWVERPDQQRERRERPESEWIVTELPELRIVPQELWDKVKARQKLHVPNMINKWRA